MKVSANFLIQEFVPQSVYEQFGINSTWFVQEKVVRLAQFYKDFFTKYYKNKFPNANTVLIRINNWHTTPGGHQFRGMRPMTYTKGGILSQHRGGAANAFDCDIIIVFNNGTQIEANYVEIHNIIQEYESMFMDAGLTAVEDIEIAATWLHSDCRWIPNQKHILIVKPKT